MKKSLFLILLLTISVCAVSCNKTSISESTFTDDNFIPCQVYTYSPPMVINSNADFATEGWSGSGILGDPYIIELLEFTDTIDGACVSISSTTAHFRIVDCTFSPTSLGSALDIDNAQNGLIWGCVTTANAHSINVFASASIDLFECTLSGTCVIFEQSEDCDVHFCSIDGAPGDGVYLVDCSSNMRIGESNISNNAASGISIELTDNTLIVNNVIRDNSLDQISITGSSSGNRVFNNEIHVGGMSGAIDNGDNNEWDDGVSIGNLWSDFSGSGFYYISGTAGSVDHYPRDHSSPLTLLTTTVTQPPTTTPAPGGVLVTAWEPMDFTLRMILVISIGVVYGVLVILAIKYFILK